jgi:hypothetical protein
MSEWITKGISRRGPVEITKNLIEEFKRICKATEVRVTLRTEEPEWIGLA